MNDPEIRSIRDELDKREKQEFKERIDKLASGSSDFVFENPGVEHAEIVLSAIFKHAKKEVCILAGSLNCGVTKGRDYVDSLLGCARRGVPLKILLEKNIQEEELTSLQKELISRSYPFDQVEIKVLKKEQDGQKFHFTLSRWSYVAVGI